VREHREQVAEEARHELREDKPEETDSVADPHVDSVGLPTGEKRAATNRDEDPPA
jgi:hypothetical protein